MKHARRLPVEPGDRTAVAFHDPFRNDQSQPRPVSLPLANGSEEPRQDVGKFRPVVGNG